MAIQEKKKLTLRLNKQLIEQAKQYAARHNLSVSELVETYFLNLKKADADDHTPLVQQLTGILPETADVEQTYKEYLAEKYGE
jgi:antitoxin component of RelBE/YafQ-DinJ toxin-antitoxin module